MNPRYYHTPPEPVSTRVRCPVCREAVYSRAGIHPQCAIRQADPHKSKSRMPRAPGHAGPGAVATTPPVAVAVEDRPADATLSAAD